MQTLSQHIRILRTFADNHIQIHSFGVGDPWEQNASGIVYASMIVEVTDSNVNDGILTDEYRIWFSDMVRHDEINELYALSNTKSLALDLIAYLDKSNALGNINDVALSHSLESYTEAFDDRVSGWILTLTIEQAFNYDYCNIPLIGDTPSGSGCPIVTIYNNDGSVNTTVPAGGSYTLPSSGGSFSYDLYFDSVDTGQNVTVDGTDITINL